MRPGQALTPHERSYVRTIPILLPDHILCPCACGCLLVTEIGQPQCAMCEYGLHRVPSQIPPPARPGPNSLGQA
jgi:hypothetical protein